ncbi:MAG: LysR substrate-binding domain-containing protein [Betaproteobacteria bacterium]|nr:LysR substrate-binding domain-containing protein [Betaproteobacteria bacterium]
MRHLTLKQLRIFEAAGRHLHFGRAAREVHLTQPAVSIQLKQLEQSAGLPLFEQIGRRMHLTRAGEELLRHCRAILERLREAEEAIEALKGAGGGELQLAVTSTAKYFAPKLLAEFRQIYPLVKVRLTVSNREAVVRELAENSADLVVMGRAPHGLDTEAVAFARHPLALISAPGHALARRPRAALARLATDTILIREVGSGTRAAMEHFFAERDFTPAETIEMSSNETIKQAVMAGMGVSFLSLHTVGLELAAGRLVVLRIAGTPVMRDWYVIHRAKKRLSGAAAAFKGFLTEQGAQMIDKAIG